MKKNISEILILATVFLIPAYLLRFDIFGIPTNVLEILALAAFISSLAQEKFSFFDFYKNNKIICWSIIMILTGILTSTLVNDNWRAGFGIIKGWFLVPILFSWAVYGFLKNGGNPESVLKWLYLGIFGVAAISLGYYFSGNITYDGRLSGIYNSPNFLAMYLAPGIFIGIYLIEKTIFSSSGLDLSEKLKHLMSQLAYASMRYNLLLQVFVLCGILFGLYLTYSYASWIAVALSLIIAQLIKNRKTNRRVILTGAIMILLILVTQCNSEKFVNLKEFSRSSLESRIMIWQAAGKILSDNPFWGIGPGNFQNKYLEYQKHFPSYLEWAVPQPHNLYLAFWLQAGIIGLSGFLIIVFIIIINLINFIRQTKNGGSAAVLIAILLYFLIHGLLDTPYWKNDLAVVFWLIVAVSLAVAGRQSLPKKQPYNSMP